MEQQIETRVASETLLKVRLLNAYKDQIPVGRSINGKVLDDIINAAQLRGINLTGRDAEVRSAIASAGISTAELIGTTKPSAVSTPVVARDWNEIVARQRATYLDILRSEEERIPRSDLRPLSNRGKHGNR